MCTSRILSLSNSSPASWVLRPRTLGHLDPLDLLDHLLLRLLLFLPPGKLPRLCPAFPTHNLLIRAFAQSLLEPQRPSMRIPLIHLRTEIERPDQLVSRLRQVSPRTNLRRALSKRRQVPEGIRILVEQREQNRSTSIRRGERCGSGVRHF